ncbi:hypothetical protein EJ07DRAFT_123296 [Lizonia empirigonia]|nr:hypothetical protein EJ07DRAFT_123296 [Lizonia empirigonia]
MIKATPQIKTIAGRISSIFKPRNSAPHAAKPPPYNDDRHYQLLRLTLVASFTLLILLSIPALVLKAYSYSFIESNAEMGFYLVNDEIPGEPQGQILVAALPDHLFRVPEKLVLVVAMLNILLSMAQLAFVAWDWKAGRRTLTRAFQRNALLLHIVNVILVLTTLIAMFVSHKASSAFKEELILRAPNAVSPSGFKYFRYDAGTFDLETWACALKDLRAAGDARMDYKAQCDIEVAGRTIMVPFFLVALAVAGVSAWALIVGGKQRPRSEFLWAKDNDLEQNKGDDGGKQVQVAEVELETLRSDRQKDGRLSKIEEDEQEVEDAPKKPTFASEAVVSGGGHPSTRESKAVDAKTIDRAA